MAPKGRSGRGGGRGASGAAGRGRGSGRRGGAPGSSADIDANAPVADVDQFGESFAPEFNGAYVSRKEKAIEKILSHPYFSGLAQMEPLAIDPAAELSGHMAVFDQTEFETSMTSNKTYTAACN
eukprot:7222561-Pyramimonas_sp.AAC.1